MRQGARSHTWQGASRQVLGQVLGAHPKPSSAILALQWGSHDQRWESALTKVMWLCEQAHLKLQGNHDIWGPEEGEVGKRKLPGRVKGQREEGKRVQGVGDTEE